MTILLVGRCSALLGGVLAGLFGVGGGIVFVPTLVFGLGLTQLHAEASSLLAILPTAIVGSWRQQRYGNVDLRAAAADRRSRRSSASRRASLAAESLPESHAAPALRRAPARHRRHRSSGGRGADREHFRPMSEHEDLWIPLVDEPIGSIVEQLQADIPRSTVSSRARTASSRSAPSPTSASASCSASCSSRTTCRSTTAPRRGSRRCCASPSITRRVVAELRAVAEEVAADPRYADEEPIGPDDAARERFREFAKKQLG